jgi:colanic acid biosynthesis protein WcaH
MRPQLPREAFATVVASAPLVSIDLLVADGRGRLLVGRRVNEPARGTWFVPGGRIAKQDGDLSTALSAIVAEELGAPNELRWDPARLAGAYTHRYPTNALGLDGVDTLYVVLAYRLLPGDVELDESRFSDQHDAYRWIGPDDDPAGVHPNTLAYL